MRSSSNLRAEQKLTVLVLFSLCLLCPLTFAQAQEKKPAQPKEKTITAKRVKQATLTAAAIRTLSAEAALARFVSINGNSIKATKGYVLLKLKTGAVLITNDPGGMNGATVRMEIEARTVAGITTIKVCACSSGNSDTCRFSTHDLSTGDKGIDRCWGESCCELTCFQFDQAGNKTDCPPNSVGIFW